MTVKYACAIFNFFSSAFMSTGWNSYLDIGSSQLQCDLVCMGPDTVFIDIIICICYASFYIHSFWYVHHSKLIIMQTFSKSLPKNKTNLLSCPKGPVWLIWCSSRTDPNIMHFPSPENLHTAQQTDKYLIGQPSVPSPPWQQLQWAWEYHRMWVPCQSLGIKAHVGTKSALLTCGRLSGWCWRRLFAWLQAPHRCQGITDE